MVPGMVNTERRDHERIDLEMPTRLWLDEVYRGKQLVFEGFAQTTNLAIGGTFVRSTYLLPVGFPINLEMHLADDVDGDVLRARGEVTHKQDDSDPGGPGMGVLFTAVDEENRERLLRFFVSDRIREFYEKRFCFEFPALRNSLSLKDVALIVNLWEDRDGRLRELKDGTSAAASTATAAVSKRLVPAAAAAAKRGAPVHRRR